LPLLPQVRTLPKVLKYLPSDKAQDARNYVNSLQYWLGGNDGERRRRRRWPSTFGSLLVAAAPSA
jgi:hypothetical protein